MEMSLNENKYLTSTCWDKQYQHHTFELTKVKFLGRCRLGLNNIFIPDSSTF